MAVCVKDPYMEVTSVQYIWVKCIYDTSDNLCNFVAARTMIITVVTRT